MYDEGLSCCLHQVNVSSTLERRLRGSSDHCSSAISIYYAIFKQSSMQLCRVRKLYKRAQCSYCHSFHRLLIDDKKACKRHIGLESCGILKVMRTVIFMRWLESTKACT